MTEQVGTADLADRLAAYLARCLPEARDLRVSDLHRSVAGTSRENWLFRAVWAEGERAVEKQLVLRRDSQDPVVATDQGTEFRVLQAIEGHVNFPAPRALWLDTTGSLDLPFMIVEFCPGENNRNVLSDASLPLEVRLRLARRFTEILATIHQLDWRALDLGFFDVPGPGKAAAIAQLEKLLPFVDDPIEPQPIIIEALHWLRANIPSAERICLLHGDFRVGNSLVLNGEVSAVLDWELAHLGDPMEDVGWYTVGMNYDREHFLPGLYHHDEFYRHYEALTGWKVDKAAADFYRTLAVFRTAVLLGSMRKKTIAQGKKSRAGVLSAHLRMQHRLADLIGL